MSAIHSKAWVDSKRKVGVCCQCGKNAAEKGRFYCATCTVYKNHHNNTRRSKARQLGLCPMCNKREVRVGAKRCQVCLDRCRVQNKARHNDLRKTVLNHYGHRCACCGEDTYEFLAIDHINNDGAEHRKQNGLTGTKIYYWLVKNGYPPGLQLLCHNCNMAKGFYGACPHQKQKQLENIAA